MGLCRLADALALPRSCSQVGHGNDAFFWTDQYEDVCLADQNDKAGYKLTTGCVMVNGMGVVVGQYGRILRTSDGGHTWENVPSPTSAHLHSLSMNEENTRSGSEFYNPQVWAPRSTRRVAMARAAGRTRHGLARNLPRLITMGSPSLCTSAMCQRGAGGHGLGRG